MDKLKIKLLIVDDEKDIRDSLKDILIDEGYEIYLAANALEAKKIKLSQTIDLILLDIWMPDIDGLSLLKEWVSKNEINCPVIMMSGHGTIDTAIPLDYSNRIKDIYPNFLKGNNVYDYRNDSYGNMLNINDEIVSRILNLN